MKYQILLFAFVLFVVGCASTPTPAPTTAAPTALPTEIPKPTVAPTNTALPPTPTSAPTNTLPPPTNTPLPTTPVPTATNTRRPVTPKPSVTATQAATVIAIKYGAPELVEPKNGDTRRLRRDAFVFRWNPVADLGSNECYQLRLRITNLADPAKHYAEQTYLVESSCSSSTGSGIVQFVVNGRAPAPNYDGLVDEANGLAGGIESQTYLVEWDVRVVLNQDGKITPLSPASVVGQFNLLGQ